MFGLLRKYVTQASSLEAQIQEQSVAELAGLTALDADLKQVPRQVSACPSSVATIRLYQDFCYL